MEKPCRVTVDGLTLEALLDVGCAQRAVVITHPHPLYGGTMSNPVVDCIRRAYRDLGYSTLRFNFRGTGNSSGEHDQGRGEMQDVLAAREYLKRLGYLSIDLAGYSFGAWVNLMTAGNGNDFERLVLVSPPVDFIEFKPVTDICALSLVISGSEDEYASPSHIKKLLKSWNKHAIFIEIPGADHFYSGELVRVEKILKERL